VQAKFTNNSHPRCQEQSFGVGTLLCPHTERHYTCDVAE